MAPGGAAGAVLTKGDLRRAGPGGGGGAADHLAVHGQTRDRAAANLSQSIVRGDRPAREW